MSIRSLADFNGAPWTVAVTTRHRHDHRPGLTLPLDTTSTGRGHQHGHQRGALLGHRWGPFMAIDNSEPDRSAVIGDACPGTDGPRRRPTRTADRMGGSPSVPEGVPGGGRTGDQPAAAPGCPHAIGPTSPWPVRRRRRAFRAPPRAGVGCVGSRLSTAEPPTPVGQAAVQHIASVLHLVHRVAVRRCCHHRCVWSAAPPLDRRYARVRPGQDRLTRASRA